MRKISILFLLTSLTTLAACASNDSIMHYSNPWDEAFSRTMMGGSAK